MSYDLYFKHRNGSLNQADLFRYFSHRHNYKIDGAQANYGNDDTGVYFQFVLQVVDEPGRENYPVAFSINYVRPSYFILEAELEISTFVRTFDLVVSDAQIAGMGAGEYRSDLLVSGWNAGNRMACATLLHQPSAREDVLSLPTEELMRIWQWNRDRKVLQEQVGQARFIPRIIMIRLGGKLFTAAVWPDGIPAILPVVEQLIVVRQEFAPKRFFRPVPDRALLAWSGAVAKLARHATLQQGARLSLSYDRPPKDVIDFVRSLPASKQEIVGLPSDKVLDRELVESAVA